MDIRAVHVHVVPRYDSNKKHLNATQLQLIDVTTRFRWEHIDIIRHVFYAFSIPVLMEIFVQTPSVCDHDNPYNDEPTLL